MSQQELFALPVPNANGTFVCTLAAPAVYLLTFTSPPDNRLTTAFCETFQLALDIIEHKYPTGVVVTTSGITKFYSNGLDLEHALSTPNFFAKHLYPLLRRLLTYPMPTVALLNGHTFAGGLIVAMHHDYRVQNPAKGFLCMNEVLFGAVMETPMISIFREKVPSSRTFRSLLLEGHRFPATQALEEGIVDALGGLDETLAFIKQRQLTSMGKSGVYRALKEDMYRESVGFLTSNEENVKWRKAMELDKGDRHNRQADKIAQWEKAGGRAAKL